MVEFIASQLGVFGPVFFVFLTAILFSRSTYRDKESLFLISLSLPVLIIISMQAFLAKANANWAAPAYIGFTIIVTHYLLGKNSRWKWIVSSLVVKTILMAGLYHYHLALSIMSINPSRTNDPYHRILGWSDLANELSVWKTQYPNAALLSGARDLLAYMSYYSSPPFIFDIASWNPQSQLKNHYHLVADIKHSKYKDFLFISHKPMSEYTLERFTFYKKLDVLRKPYIKISPEKSIYIT